MAAVIHNGSTARRVTVPMTTVRGRITPSLGEGEDGEDVGDNEDDGVVVKASKDDDDEDLNPRFT